MPRINWCDSENIAYDRRKQLILFSDTPVCMFLRPDSIQGQGTVYQCYERRKREALKGAANSFSPVLLNCVSPEMNLGPRSHYARRKNLKTRQSPVSQCSMKRLGVFLFPSRWHATILDKINETSGPPLPSIQ